MHMFLFLGEQVLKCNSNRLKVQLFMKSLWFQFGDDSLLFVEIVLLIFQRHHPLSKVWKYEALQHPSVIATALIGFCFQDIS